MNDLVIWLGTLSSLRKHVEIGHKISNVSIDEITKARKALASDYDYDEDEDEWGNEHPLLSRFGNIAVVSVKGSISNRPDDFITHLFGLTTYEGIRNALAIAAEDESIDAILMDFNTPGGTVSGISETSEFMREVKTVKPVYGYAEAALSAGYWLASNTDKIYATEMGELGSIGVISITSEVTKMLEDRGETLNVFKSGELKALGNPYEKLTEEGKQVLQKRVEEIAEFFVKEVSTNRGMTISAAEQVATGDFWFARKAIELNLADGIESFNKLVQTLQSKHQKSGEGNDMPKRRVLNERGVTALASGATIEEVLKDKNLSEGVEENIEEDEDQEEEERQDIPEEDQEDSDDPEEGDDEEASEETAAKAGANEPRADDGSANSLLEKLLASERRVAILENDLQRKEDSEAQNKEIMEQFEAYVRTAAERMEVPLGGSGTGLKDLSGLELINHAMAIRGKFEERFKVGQSAVSKIEEAKDEGDSGLSPEFEQAKSISTRIKRGK